MNVCGICHAPGRIKDARLGFQTIIRYSPSMLRGMFHQRATMSETRSGGAWLRALFTAVFALVSTACTTTELLTPSPAVELAKVNARYTSIVMDAGSGKVLMQQRADAKRFPASLTKMMTLYLMFEALDRGKLTMNTPIPVSARASAEPASKLWLKPGTTLTVNEAIQALVVVSANDVAYAVAEKLGGSEARFAQMMTRKARSIGMGSTTFRNASGLPNKAQISTARDMARLGMALKRNFPRYFGFFSRNSMKFRGKARRGHNRVLRQLKGANGIKTGYTRASGFNLVTSVNRGGKTIIGVVMGANSGRKRDAHMVELMETAMARSGIR